MSYSKSQSQDREPTVKELQAELTALREEIEIKREKFQLKDRLTQFLAQSMPRHVLFSYSFLLGLAEIMSDKEINIVVDYLKQVQTMQSEKDLIEAFRQDMLNHRVTLNRKAEMDAKALEAKAKQPSPAKAPELDMKPVKIGV